jgi:hypothetical protein
MLAIAVPFHKDAAVPIAEVSTEKKSASVTSSLPHRLEPVWYGARCALPGLFVLVHGCDLAVKLGTSCIGLASFMTQSSHLGHSKGISKVVRNSCPSPSGGEVYDET